jgi:hypothetical protein
VRFALLGCVRPCVAIVGRWIDHVPGYLVIESCLEDGGYVKEIGGRSETLRGEWGNL